MRKSKPVPPRRTDAPEKNSARSRENTTKRRGELSELAFTFKAARMGFGVAKPYGDSERYDFILDAGQGLWRV
jgi:PD-(D/E)XK endonuclease